MRPWWRAVLVLGVVVAADQASKAIVRGALTPGDEDPIFPGVELVHVRNRGIAFGAFSDGGVLVPVVVGVALLALVVYFATHADRPLAWLPTGLLIGGALGNIVDRLRLGAVTDFIKVPAWPAFNLADVSITFGILALIVALERDQRSDGDRGRAR
jgi:signal peptidase II